MLSFKLAFSLLSFTFVNRFLSSSSISAIRRLSSAYLRFLILFLEILIPPCASSIPAFYMIYSIQKLNKKGENIALMHSFPNLEPVCGSMFGSNCCFLTCIEVSQEAGKVVWYSHLFKKSPQFVVIHTVNGFIIVNETKVEVFFLEFSCFFYDPTDVGNLSSSFSAFSKSRLNFRKFSVHAVLKTCLEKFEKHFASMWNECNCVVVWTWQCLSLGLIWKLTFSSPVPLLQFFKFPEVEK